jgi:hypothetical protein
MIDVDVFPSDTSSGVHQFGGGSEIGMLQALNQGKPNPHATS